jgi:hypothetical protein
MPGNCKLEVPLHYSHAAKIELEGIQESYQLSPKASSSQQMVKFPRLFIHLGFLEYFQCLIDHPES